MSGASHAGCRVERIAKNNGLQKSFLQVPGVFSLFVGGLGSRFSGFCCHGNRLEYARIVDGVTDSQSGGR